MRSLGVRSTVAAALAILLALVVVGVGVDVLVPATCIARWIVRCAYAQSRSPS